MVERFQEYQETVAEPEVKETKEQLLEKRKAKKQKTAAARLEKQTEKWNPKENQTPDMTSDAYKTLFVARLVSVKVFPSLALLSSLYSPSFFIITVLCVNCTDFTLTYIAHPRRIMT